MTKNWKVIGYNEVTREVQEVACIKTSSLNAAISILASEMPEHYYGANVVQIDAQGEEVPGGDFACLAVKSYYEIKGLPLPA